jgi:hypothetical protein
VFFSRPGYIEEEGQLAWVLRAFLELVERASTISVTMQERALSAACVTGAAYRGPSAAIALAALVIFLWVVAIAGR